MVGRLPFQNKSQQNWISTNVNYRCNNFYLTFQILKKITILNLVLVILFMFYFVKLPFQRKICVSKWLNFDDISQIHFFLKYKCVQLRLFAPLHTSAIWEPFFHFDKASITQEIFCSEYYDKKTNRHFVDDCGMII